MQTGKAIRLNDILKERALLLDTSIASSVGATRGLEDVRTVLVRCAGIFDGIVLNPGQLEHLSAEIGGRNRAAPLVRVDWTNAHRGADFCLPAAQVKRVEISDAEDVMRLGGSAAVATLLMGYDDDFEAENIQSVSRLIRAADGIALPVFVDIRITGPKVSQNNADEAVKLGVSFMMEAGADALIIPESSDETLALIGTWSTVPVLIRSDRWMEKMTGMQIRGFLFSERILEHEDALRNLTAGEGR